MIFSAEQAACISGCTMRQLRYWRDTGLIEPAVPPGRHGGREGYDFRNLVELRTVVGMLKRGISLQKIRKTLDFLRQKADCSRPLSECKLITDGSTIFEICERPQQLLDTLRKGQIAFYIALDGIMEELENRLVEFKRDREEFMRRLLA
ncbi:MerR family transcriptional regulator [Candidatus Solincola sp.]|nr:MerR family transcriptional regulator [Actinomycetota bacterium]MDI7251693.1 MerR family transcriptional regulator [Actinomycetota bacterium]